MRRGATVLFGMAMALLVLAVGTAGAAPEGGRAYELVSPPDKNGGEVMGDSTKVTAAADGESVAFVSLVGFAETAGSALALDYIAERDERPNSNGWSTRSIAPFPQEPLPIRFSSSQATSYRLFSPDLKLGVLRALSPLTEAPNVAQTRNLYLRSDLDDPQGGTYELLTDAFAPVAIEPFFTIGGYQPSLADASADFRRVIFESSLRLTPDAPSCPDPDPKNCTRLLYEWADGTVRLAGILPDGSAANASVAGRSAAEGRYTLRTISADGRRIFFTVPTGIGPDGRRSGELYMRLDGTSSVHLNASERTGSLDPDGSQPATFWDATPDGSRVFFTTAEQLTDDDANDTSDLYRYDVDAADGEHLTLVSIDAGGRTEVRGVAAISADGESVYFMGFGQAIAGEPTEPQDRLYLSRGGSLRDIGGVGSLTRQRIVGEGTYNIIERASRVSADGRYLVFVSSEGEGLTGFDHGDDFAQIYLYDSEADSGAGVLRCVSCNVAAGVATSSAALNATIGLSVTLPRPYVNRALSADGRVFFSTGERLSEADINGSVRDVYEFDPADGSLGLVSSGRNEFDSFFLDASMDGNDLFFLTRERLSRWDVDSAYDIYDARVGGGLPEPPEPGVPCSGGGCQGPPGGPPPKRNPSTAVVTGDDAGAAEGVVFRLLRPRAAQVRRWAASGVLRLRVRVSEGGRLRARVRGSVQGRTRTLAAASRSIGGGGTVTLALGLSRAAREHLGAGETLRATVSVTFSETDISRRIVVVLRGGGAR